MPVRNVIVYSIIMALCLMCSGCAGRPPGVQEYSRDNFLMDTPIHIIVYSSDPQLGRKALDAAFVEFARIDNLARRFSGSGMQDPDSSEVFRVNQNAGVKPVQVSEDTLAMLEKSRCLAGMCGGAFDVSVGPLIDLWGFGHSQSQSQYHVPSESELEQKLALVGYDKIVVDKARNTVFLPEKGMVIDLGGIAKGYATDKAVEKLRRMGVTSAMINAGGNIYALGSKPDGSPWKVGLQDPRDEKKIIAVLRVKDTAVVTSGDYERYFMRDGVRYHHILDPATGNPARNAISTTIVAPSATDADALSTGLFVLGPGQGAELAKGLKDVYAVFVDDQRYISMSPELHDRIEFMGGSGYRVKEVR